MMEEAHIIIASKLWDSKVFIKILMKMNVSIIRKFLKFQNYQ